LNQASIVQSPITLISFALGASAQAVAHAKGCNQVAIDAAKAETQVLLTMPIMQQQVVLGQLEIANPRAIARLLSHDSHAQTKIPNSMEQYRLMCNAAIDHMQAKVTNASAMVAAKPWDAHAQAELANANAMNYGLWEMIGDTYPGNPFHSSQGRSPGQYPILSDDELLAAADGEFAVAEAADDAPDTLTN
jgi:hypothetical protein